MMLLDVRVDPAVSIPGGAVRVFGGNDGPRKVGADCGVDACGPGGNR
jgi:hypothetical protein